jgi:chitosanase
LFLIVTTGNITPLPSLKTMPPKTYISGAEDDTGNTVDDDGRTKSRTIVLTYKASDNAGAVAGVEASIDGGAWTVVPSNPFKVSNLPVGSHKIRVRAFNAAGNRDPVGDEFAWIIVSGSGTGSSGNRSPPAPVVLAPQVVLPSTEINPPPLSGTEETSEVDLTHPTKKEIAFKLVSSAENSSLDWKAQYSYIEDISDGRGYTAGIMGFCSGTGDLLEVVQYYTQLKPNNVLAKYLPALQRVIGTASHAGLDPTFINDWKTASKDVAFQQAQDHERDTVYFNPAVNQAKADGLHALGQFIYFDAYVMHGPGDDALSFGGIRAAAVDRATLPSQGGDEVAYLNAFLDARVNAMLSEESHQELDRVENAQRVFLRNGNLHLDNPLSWTMYGDKYHIR